MSLGLGASPDPGNSAALCLLALPDNDGGPGECPGSFTVGEDVRGMVLAELCRLLSLYTHTYDELCKDNKRLTITKNSDNKVDNKIT